MTVLIVEKLPGTVSDISMCMKILCELALYTCTLLYKIYVHVGHWKNPLLSVMVNLVFCTNMQAGRGGLCCHGDGV